MGQLKINGLAATNDLQLTTPKHDEMMKMLFNKKIQKELEQFNGLEDEIKNYTIYERRNILDTNLINIKVDLEVPLKTNTGFIIGIIDAVINYTYEIKYTYEDEQEHTTHFTTCCGIEIKPRIQSIGEVMRQLKIYADYLTINKSSKRKARIVIFTQDETEREIFESQNIGYLSLQQMGDLK